MTTKRQIFRATVNFEVEVPDYQDQDKSWAYLYKIIRSMESKIEDNTKLKTAQVVDLKFIRES